MTDVITMIYLADGIPGQLLTYVLDVAGPGKTVNLIDKDAPLPKPKKNKEGKDVAQELVKEAKEVESVYLHVQTSNDEAKAFYEKHGFVQTEILPEYYKIGIEPRSAWVLEKKTG
jgi:GNAT superfamily N-acetyltransferase